MAENELPFVEGASIHRPPMFTSVNCQFWKIRIKIFIISIDQGIWNAMMNEPFIPKYNIKDKCNIPSRILLI